MLIKFILILLVGTLSIGCATKRTASTKNVVATQGKMRTAVDSTKQTIDQQKEALDELEKLLKDQQRTLREFEKLE